MLGLLLAALVGSPSSVHAAVTVYQIPLATATSPASANYTGAASYDAVQLTAPALPNPAPPMQFTLPIQASSDGVPNLSIKQDGMFYGFSVEMSVVTQVSEYRPQSAQFL